MTTQTDVKRDRAELISVLDQFLDAVVNNDVSGAPLAPGFRSTENCVETQPGEGIWSTSVGLNELQRRYVDPVSGQVGYYGLIDEANAPAIAAVRVRVADGQVSEAEWTIARKQRSDFYSADGMIANPPTARPVAPELRSSREDLIAAADSYYDGLEAYDWSMIKARPEGYRVENGIWVTGRFRDPKPGDGITQPTLGYETEMRGCNDFTGERVIERPVPILDRHYFVDEEVGMVWYNAILKGEFPSLDVMESGRLDDPTAPGWHHGLYVSELFKVEAPGLIRGIHVVMKVMPLDWDTVSGAGFPATA